MPHEDKLTVGDALEATVSTPDDESEAVSGAVVAEHRGASLPHEVQKEPRGYAAYVSWQDAPITVRNVTFADSDQAITDNLDAWLATVTQSQCDQALGRPA